MTRTTDIDCPTCKSPAGQQCTWVAVTGQRVEVYTPCMARIEAADQARAAAFEDRVAARIAAWLEQATGESAARFYLTELARNAQHSAKTCEHGSPPEVVELGRHTLGAIDLDPASTAYWNLHTVRAARFYDRQDNGLVQPWSGRVWLNPPGADEQAGTPSLVRPFWERAVAMWRSGAVDGLCWEGYSLEQLQMLQSSPFPPAKAVTLLLGRRLRHLRRVEGGPPVPGDAPTHGSFVTLLTSVRDPAVARGQIDRFRGLGARLGVVVRPI